MTTLSITSPAVIAAARECHRRNPLLTYEMCLKDTFYVLQAAGVGELVEALDRIHTAAVGDAACTHDSETFAAIKASRPLVAKFTGG